jgi:hypothetical protein
MPNNERVSLAGRIERVLGHEPRTRDEIALAVGYIGREVSIRQALDEVVSNGRAIQTPAGWRAPR